MHAIKKQKLPRRKLENPSVNRYAGKAKSRNKNKMSKSQKMED